MEREREREWEGEGEGEEEGEGEGVGGRGRGRGRGRGERVPFSKSFWENATKIFDGCSLMAAVREAGYIQLNLSLVIPSNVATS